MRYLRVSGPINRGVLRRPFALACLLGLASAAPVAWWLLQPPRSDWERSTGWQQLELLEVLILAVVSVLAASIVGGGLAGRALSRHRTSSPLLAIGLAWPTAIAVLPIAASVFRIPLRAGIVCIDSCSATLTSARPLSGFEAYLSATIVGAVTLITSLPALGIALVGVWLGQRGHRLASAGAMVVGYGCLYVWTIAFGGALPFALLAIGVVVWAYAAAREESRQSTSP